MEQAEGSAEAKRRLRAILETVAGTKSVPEACAALGIEEARFYQLREKAVEAAVAGLEASAPGRPKKEEPAEAARVKELEEERKRLLFELQVSRTREEIAVALPHVLKRGGGNRRAAPAEKKTALSSPPRPIITNPPGTCPGGRPG